MQEGSSNVQVILQSLEWKEIGRFPGYENMSFYQMAEKHNIEIPVSCCSGACFVCCAQIKQWHEAVQVDKLSMPLVDVERDESTGERKEVLTCIWGIKSECFKDGKYHEIVLQKLM